MTVTATKVSEGFTTKPGQGVEGIFGIAWDDDTTTVATGDLVDLTDHFSKILSVECVGFSAIGLAAYTPQFFFDPTATHTASNLKMVMNMIPELEIDDTVDISAQGLTPADGVDLTAAGTVYVRVCGLPT